MGRILLILSLIAILITLASSGWAKQCSRLVTQQMRKNALKNAEKFDWAAQDQQNAIDSAQRYIEMSDEDLWKLIPSQDVPRGIHTNNIVGCPNCGDGIVPYGNYPWICDFRDRPWKIECPNCGEVYPKNDFGAFYESALDEHGFFRRELGDRSLLFNAEHPDPNDPLHDVYVDDGYGMKDEEGNTHYAIAYYTQWGLWRKLYSVMSVLARAYTLTSEPIYAHKCAVMLDRVADVYPEMRIRPFAEMGMNHSGAPGGRIEGRIWETNTGRRFAQFYDYIYDGIQDDAELVDFCSSMAERYNLGDKDSVEDICRHIEDNLLLEILQATRDADIWGNTGMHQLCVATTAIALDREGTTEEWLDWLFDPMYPGEFIDRHDNWKHDPLPWVLQEGLDRDGMGGECGGYGLIWTGRMRLLPPLFEKYPEYDRHDLVADYPKLKQAFLVEGRLNALDAAMPNIGDVGACARWSRRGDAEVFAQGFDLYGERRLAELAWRYAEGRIGHVGRDIFKEDPDELGRRIEEVAEGGSHELQCEHMGRYGQAMLQTKRPENGRALWMHYGYGKGHSHHDNLNLGLYAKNIDMLPELGYPEYTGPWPKRMGWTSHTVSHNTVMVNDRNLAYSPGGKIRLFVDRAPVRLIEVDSPDPYQGAIEGLQTYRRTAALIDISPADSYVFDVFRVRGGQNHRLSYHGPGIEVETTALSLNPQDGGTMAGENVEFGEFFDGTRGSWGYNGSGLMYLYDVERSEENVEEPFTVDWLAKHKPERVAPGHDPHLRLHSLSQSDEVALATGDPPQNKGSVHRSLRYLLQTRRGEDLQSQFITVLEPYDRDPFIQAVRELEVEHEADEAAVAAVAVELLDGTVDILISCEEPTVVTGENGLKFDGKFGMIRLVDGQVECMRMAHARLVEYNNIRLSAERAAYTGVVSGINADDSDNNLVHLDPPLPPHADLVGQAIHFDNDIPIDTTYDIRAVTDQGISTGDITIIRGLKDNSNFASGYEYLVNPGDTYCVPCVVGLDRGADAH